MTRQRILLVCMGNICRSPMAEGVLRRMAEQAGLAGRVEFDSAGTQGAHVGERPDERARKVAAARGYDISKRRARQVRDADYGRFDLILAMDQTNLATLRRNCPPDATPEIDLFLVRAGIAEPREMPDPYYGGIAGFERVLDLCEAAGRGLIETLRGR